ncbi:MAG: transcriptional regulator [Gemmatirosa sp.]|nr:transcriptional regulator [Gemmatirosa sp.]
MRYLSVYQTVERNAPPTQEEMAAMGRLIEEMTAAGVLIATEGCLPTSLGMRVRRAGDRVTVVDGPFTEAKEVIAGFALIEAASKEEALAHTKRFLEVAGDGVCEVRQLYTPPAGDTHPRVG